MAEPDPDAGQVDGTQDQPDTEGVPAHHRSEGGTAEQGRQDRHRDRQMAGTEDERPDQPAPTPTFERVRVWVGGWGRGGGSHYR